MANFRKRYILYLYTSIPSIGNSSYVKAHRFKISMPSFMAFSSLVSKFNAFCNSHISDPSCFFSMVDLGEIIDLDKEQNRTVEYVLPF